MADIDYDLLSEKLATAIVRAMATDSKTKDRAKEIEDQQRNEINSLKELVKRQLDATKAFKDFSGGTARINQLIRGQTKSLIDVDEALKKLDEEIEIEKEIVARFGAQVNEAGEEISHNTIRQKELNRVKQEEAILEANKKVALINTTIGLGKFSDSLVTTVGAVGANFVRELQRGGNNIDISTNLLKGGVDVAKTTVGGFASAMEMAGEVGLLIAKRFKPFYVGLIAIGKALGFATEKAAELSKFAFDILGEEIKKTIDAYQKSSSAGALFADGMSGLRNAAGAAGLTLTQFSEMIAKHTNDLAEIGEGITGGAVRVGRVLDPLTASGSKLRSELLNLGFNIEEHGGLVAETMAMMRQSGGRLMASDEEVRQQTTKYAENLRIVAAITGEDAKKKAEAVRQQANQLAFQQKLAQMPEQQRAATLRAMNVMSDLERKNFMDMVNFGTVINKEGAAAQAMSGALQDLTSDHYQKFRDRTLDDTTVLDAQKQYGGALKDQILSLVDIGAAGAANLGGFVQSLSEAYGKELAFRNRSTQEAIDAARENVTKQKETVDPLTTTISDINKQMQQFKVILEQEILGKTGALTMYAQTMGKMNDEILKQIRKLQGKGSDSDKDDKKEESFWEDYGKDLTKTVVGAGLIVASGALATTGVGAPVAALTSAAGLALLADAGISQATKGIEAPNKGASTAGAEIPGGNQVGAEFDLGMATGGIIKGPRRILAGENPKFPFEAFVPLPDGKTIPVTVKMADAESSSLIVPREVTDLYQNLTSLAVASSKSVLTSGQTAQDLNDSFIREIGVLSKFVDDSNKTFTSNLTESRTYINDAIKTFADTLAVKQFASQSQQRDQLAALASPDVTYTTAIKQTLDLNLSEFKNEIRTVLDDAKTSRTEIVESAKTETRPLDLIMAFDGLNVSNKELKSVLEVQNKLLEQNIKTVEELVSVASDTRNYSQTIAQNTL